MQFRTTTLFVAGLVAQQTTAQGWNDARSYSCPGNTDNHCSSQQQTGYDFSNLQPGSFNSYGSNQFSGFRSSNAFGKRDALTKRQFQGCIEGNLDDSPTMYGGSFSIDHMQVSSSYEGDVECHYEMPDSSTCKEVHSASTVATTFQNTQCGGAKSVSFKPSQDAPSGASIGVHSINFNCGSPPASSSPPPSEPSISPPCYGRNCSSPALPPRYTAPSGRIPPYPTGTGSACYGARCGNSSYPPVYSAPSCYGPKCNSPSYSGSPPSYSSPHGSAPPQCPDILPKCLQTWMFSTSCKDNSDSSCFCQNEEYITNVYGCLSAWATTDSDVSSAAGYLMGICAPHVPSNPAIITGCPSTVTPAGPTPPAYTPVLSSPVVSRPGVPTPDAPTPYAPTPDAPTPYAPTPDVPTPEVPTPYVTSPYATTPDVSPTPPCTTVSYSSNTYTVPQVYFSSSTFTTAGSTTYSVGLETGLPTGVPAQVTSPGSTLGTSYGTATPPIPSSSPVVPATGAGAKANVGLAGFALAGIAALAAL